MIKQNLSILALIMGAQCFGYIHFHHPIEALTIAARFLPANPVILEAGSYDGKEAVEMLRYFGRNKLENRTVIHTFEPIPYLKTLVDNNTQQFSAQIHSYEYALSDSTGQAIMYVSEEPNKPNIPSMSSSLLPPKEHLNHSSTMFKTAITVPTMTIDDWAQKYGVNHIDMMWLDMQGYELNALKACPNILKTVKVILTEVEFIEAYKGQYLYQDIKDWLESQGFTMVAENFGHFGWFADVLFVRL